ncbi:MAG: Maf family protein [Sandaracinaceae bacterium]|nr:Maf family protein [Sandaracinaceae bacterium]
MSAHGFVLASASPRRREILGTLGLRFDVEVSAIDEAACAGESPGDYVHRIAGDKARAVAERIAARDASDTRAVLAADTTVVVDGAILGKPEDDADARRMLRALSGRAHEVLTAVVVCSRDRDELVVRGRVVRTEVSFRALEDAAIEAYLSSGEHRDKAGAYGIQGLAMGFVTDLRGSYTNVVGLPAAETVDLLVESGAIARWPLAERAR